MTDACSRARVHLPFHNVHNVSAAIVAHAFLASPAFAQIAGFNGTWTPATIRPRGGASLPGATREGATSSA